MGSGLFPFFLKTIHVIFVLVSKVFFLLFWGKGGGGGGVRERRGCCFGTLLLRVGGRIPIQSF